ncbi:hypothetical protein [Tautonia plasticadhaerens]|uniref:Uncharacterized protein n=1 Tax=Tautonia plasticadhaerens TaxID=2527974 RepID=A0A518HD71_9BACT|nr:hypothetical protein [Tautonia plasticadhaerens]QDV38804.1 hypothetical protein ElP_67610 [Tautonia plasticadhaerens]
MTIAPPGPGRAPAAGLPGSIRSVLARVGRRLDAAAAMRGLGLTLGVSAAIAAAAMAVDLLRPIPTPVRWAGWLAWVGVSSTLLIRGVLGPLLRRHRPDALAAVAGRGLPDRGATLTAAVSLAGAGGRAHGSPELIAALVDRAVEEAGSIEPGRAVPLARAARRLAIGLAAAGVVALPAIVAPDPFAALSGRFLAPWSDPGSAGLLAIAVEPGDAVVARGGPLAVSASVRARSRLAGPPPETALLQWTGPDGASHALELGPGKGEPRRDDARGFALTLPSIEGPITYRVVAGSARSRPYRVRVVDPPLVSSHRWTIAPPPYTGRDAEEVVGPAGATAWQDSRVTIVASTDRPARRVVLSWPAEPASGDRHEGKSIDFEPSADGRAWTVEVSATASGPYELVAEDEHGLVGRPGRSGRLEVVVDAPPAVALADGEEAAGPGDRLALPVASRDDVAVCSAELHVAVLRADAGPGSLPEPLGEPIPLVLDGLGTPAARGVAGLDLAPLGLGDGDALSVRVRVLDNRPPPRGPNEGWSAPIPVAIVADVQQFDADRLEARLGPIREELQSLARQAAENQRNLPPLRADAEAARRDDDAWSERSADDLDCLAEAARGLVDRLQLLSRALEADPTLGPLADPVRQAAEAEADDARQALDDARRDEEDPDARLDDLRRAEAELAGASRRLDDLNRRLNSLARAAAARPELADLAGREGELADQARALADGAEAEDQAEDQDDDVPPPPAEPPGEAKPTPPIDPEALRRLRESQDQLSRALDELLRRAPALRDDDAAAEARADAEAARRDLDRAAAGPDPGDPSRSPSEAAREAAEAMRRAAEQLRRASGSADPSSRAERLARLLADQAGEPSSPSDGDPSASPPRSIPAGPSDPAAAFGLRSERSWGDLPGHLRTELLQSSPDRYRPDYAALIRLYFREIARGASDPGPAPDPGPGGAP